LKTNFMLPSGVWHSALAKIKFCAFEALKFFYWQNIVIKLSDFAD